MGVLTDMFAANDEELDRLDIDLGPDGGEPLVLVSDLPVGPDVRPWWRRLTAPPPKATSERVPSGEPPIPPLRTVQAKGVMEVELGKLEEILTGTPLAVIEDDLSAGVSMRSDQGVPPSSACDPPLPSRWRRSHPSPHDAAVRWSRIEEWSRRSDADDLARLLLEYAALAREAHVSGRRLYLWMTP